MIYGLITYAPKKQLEYTSRDKSEGRHHRGAVIHTFGLNTDKSRINKAILDGCELSSVIWSAYYKDIIGFKHTVTTMTREMILVNSELGHVEVKEM